jgi:hypothetical protein
MRLGRVCLGYLLAILSGASCQPEKTQEGKAMAGTKPPGCCTKPIPSRLSQMRSALGMAHNNLNMPGKAIK